MGSEGIVKKYPIRRCIGCGESFKKSELIRVIRTPENEIVIDAGGKKSGRGVYICKKQSCFNKAKKAGRFTSNLKTEIPDEVYLALQEELKVYEQG